MIQNIIFLKYIMNYIIRKLFMNSRLTSRLCNLEYGVAQEGYKDIFIFFIEVTEERMKKVQEETIS